jgi:hypothetical protein
MLLALAAHAQPSESRSWCERPIHQRFFDVSFETIAPCRRHLDGCNAVFQHSVMRRLLETQPG